MLSYSAPRRITRNGKRTRFYYCRYYDPATRTQQWITTRCDTLKDAKVWRARKLREEADPDLAAKMRNRDRTLIAAAEEWLASKGGNVTEPHFQQIESKVHKLWTPFFRKKRLVDVQATDIEELIQQRRAGKLRPRATKGRPARPRRPLQAATANFDLDVLRTFFVWCLEKKRWINISPAKSASKVAGERVRAHAA